ncbi:Permease of the drug/metabolite transporter superfamily (plasmid) [Deinococcus geothermalis DSM 11300]|uniref:Permease of the drug/metabolite transporter superfamily n=1 Tax=Deinococcus geothermalis (strain DSM 11300 / CIP 105573 / AG-3a) TaxID=319795 RepID=A8ZRB6_DEIGD|nr:MULTISPECIES: DMT family transporter [Deinococcus]ABW35025.1 Permease of the drug/metabolite transporter superfamily [Deinococcus geothermalis DSM 11300]TDE84775.1 DMT family transporter [Deinococcus sp. S9]
MLNRPLLAELSLVLIALLWGTSFLVNQHLLGTLSPAALGTERFAVAAFTLLLLQLGTRQAPGTLKRVLLPGALIGLFNGAAYLTLNAGLVGTTAGKAAFLVGGSAVLVPLFGWLLFRHRITALTAACVATATLGLLLLSGATNLTLGAPEATLLLSAALFAVQVLLGGHYARSLPPLPLLTAQLTVAALVSLAVTALRGESLHLVTLVSTPSLLGSLFILAVPATAIAYVWQLRAQQVISPTRVVMIFLLEPVFAALSDYLFLGNLLRHSQLLGAVLILAGLILMEVLPRLRVRLPLSPLPQSTD